MEFADDGTIQSIRGTGIIEPEGRSLITAVDDLGTNCNCHRHIADDGHDVLFHLRSVRCFGDDFSTVG